MATAGAPSYTIDLTRLAHLSAKERVCTRVWPQHKDCHRMKLPLSPRLYNKAVAALERYLDVTGDEDGGEPVLRPS